MLERYIAMRAQHPAWFQQLSLAGDPLLADLVSRGYVLALPGRDRAGRRVIHHTARLLDPAVHTTSHVMRAHIATFEVGGDKSGSAEADPAGCWVAGMARCYRAADP